MSVKTEAFEKDGTIYKTLELSEGNGSDGNYRFTFGLSKARLIVANMKAIEKFVNDNKGL